VGWAEWNDRYRDAVRSYWKGDGGLIGELAYRMTGSSDLYERSGRRPYASINFVTAHDGFTLRDLVSYNEKHNEANLEENRDGTSNNQSWNVGVEGPTDDPAVNALRLQQSRNFIATLFLSQGVPMLLAGDSFGHTQQGNNNAYCQDNELNWLNWDLQPQDRELLAFTQRMIMLRKKHPALHRRNFFHGRPIKGVGVKDILWLTPDGCEMTDEEWKQSSARCLGMYLAAEGLQQHSERGEPIADDNFLILMNAHHEAIPFTLPTLGPTEGWHNLVDTAWMDHAQRSTHDVGAIYPLQARSLVLLIEHLGNDRRRSA
jgi:glycogen operon protein